MASSSSAAAPAALGPPVTEKLTRDNFVLWRAQVLPALRGALLTDYLDGTAKEPAKTRTTVDKNDKEIISNNPEYAKWMAQDQQVLVYLLNSLSKDVLQQVATFNTSAQVWEALTNMYASQSRARVTNLRISLANTRKGSMTTAVYFSKMKALADDLASAGKPVDDESLVSYILAGLDIDYNPLVSTVVGRSDPISLSDLYSQMVSYDNRMDHLQGGGQIQSSANAASRGSGNPRGGNNNFRGRGNGGRGRGNGGRGGGQQGPRPVCQLCGKTGHTVIKCWYRFDQTYQPEEKVAAAATNSAYGVDTNWYVDCGATDHVTGELDKLSIREKYNGQDQVHAANGSGMNISHIGHSVISTPNKDLYLKNILHVPSASKSLVSANRLAHDNNAFVEIYPKFFNIKDQATKKLLHHGRSEGRLYPLAPASGGLIFNKNALSIVKPSPVRWHYRLGHPSFQIVNRVIQSFNLPCSFDSNNVDHSCDSCQRAKSHQLPYAKSISSSTVPFALIFSDVWGPAPTSVGRHNYYVSFIDDYSKYTWIYLLKKKSDVFQAFLNFQRYVERQFNTKILIVQSDWGGEYEKLNSFFQKIGIVHHVSCPHAHQQNGSAERKHRDIVEKGLALLSQASVPLKFWDEAFLTATYLINRLPSSVLNFQTPFQHLYSTAPEFNHLKVFGCACWPNLRPFNSRKLSYRSIRCAFLGYSPLHKGYKCLDISTGRVYISRDVIFDETVFPFASLHTNAGARLRREISLLPAELLSTIDHGGEITNDHMTSCSTNPVNLSGGIQATADGMQTGENSEENLVQNDANLHQISHKIMEESSGGTSSRSEEIHAAASTASAGVSAATPSTPSSSSSARSSSVQESSPGSAAHSAGSSV